MPTIFAVNRWYIIFILSSAVLSNSDHKLVPDGGGPKRPFDGCEHLHFAAPSFCYRTRIYYAPRLETELSCFQQPSCIPLRIVCIISILYFFVRSAELLVRRLNFFEDIARGKFHWLEYCAGRKCGFKSSMRVSLFWKGASL